MSFPDDEAFLLAVAATEEAALASSKRRRLSTSSSASASSSPTAATPPPAAVPEGSYLAALKGSHSLAWKQQQETLSQACKRPGGSQTLAAPAGGRGGACFKCGDSSHRARDCPQSVPVTGSGGGAYGGTDGGGGGGYVDAGGAVEEKACPCGAGSCLVLTSNTPRNPGRKFYRCPMRFPTFPESPTRSRKSQRSLQSSKDNGGCNFFEWCDTPSPSPANVCSNAVFQLDKSMANVLCPCGAGACLILTAKTGNNVGRQFFRCPANQGGSSCGFFKWFDEQLRKAAPLQASTQYHTDVASSGQIPSKRSSSACFKCGQESHWAKDCPNQSSDPYPDKGGRTFTSANSPDACFKCGKAGHWSRDCPTANCGSGTVTSHVKSSSTLGSWNSHRY